MLGDHPASQCPLVWCRQMERQGFLKLWMLLYLPKVLPRGWFCQPGPWTAMGGWGGVPAQSWWARLGQPCCGAVFPRGAHMGLLPSGSRVTNR